MNEFRPEEISEADKLRMAMAGETQLPELNPFERAVMEIDFEAFDRNVTPQEILAERLNNAVFGDNKDD